MVMDRGVPDVSSSSPNGREAPIIRSINHMARKPEPKKAEDKKRDEKKDEGRKGGKKGGKC
jgi:hypothetical protein